MKERIYKKEISKPLFILTIAIYAIAAFIIGMLIQLKWGTFYAITSGSSMEKTLTDGTKLLMKSAEYTTLKRGDIVSLPVHIKGEKASQISIMKRIIALPNETIHINGSKVYINDQLLDEPYAYYSETSESDLTLTINEGRYFVMGDNRMNSIDSRWFGTIQRENITDVLVKSK